MAQKKYLDYSGLSAYDELIKDYVSEQKHTYTASEVTFDNTGTSMTATNVQAAITELEAGGSGGGVGKDLSGQTVKPTSSTEVTAGEGAEIFNDYKDRTYDSQEKVTQGNIASGFYSHAEGGSTTASGDLSHAEGFRTVASGMGSHSEGYNTTASGGASHAEGGSTTASGETSHAEGSGTTAQRKSQHVFGEFNILDTAGTDTTTKGNYVEIVGNGTTTDARSNARTLDWSGNETLAGKLTLGSAPTNNMDAATKEYVDTAIQTNITAVLNASY